MASSAVPPPFAALPDGYYGISLGGWTQTRPLEVEIVNRVGLTTWLSSSYSALTASGCGTGNVTSTGGARLAFFDCFEVDAASWSVTVWRSVTIEGTSADEVGFSTRFSLAPASTAVMDFFMPGIWYRGSPELAPPDSLAGDPDAPHILVREDRLPLPLVMARSRAVPGAYAELVHLEPDGASFAGEDGVARIIDGRMLFGSLGVVRVGAARRLAFVFPGSEGDRTYVREGASPLPRGTPRRRRVSTSGWANRSHPLRAEYAAHRYTLRFTVTPTSATYDDALERTWRRAFDEAAPAAPAANATAVYRASMSLLSTVAQTYHGVPSMPFRMDLGSGTVDDTSSQMGFVGKALPAAALLLHDAIDAGDAARRARAEAIVDFWAANSLRASIAGVPQTWYNIQGDTNGSWFFRQQSPYNGHIRIMSEGMDGLLRAYTLLPKRSWLAAATRFGDFLVASQRADGSIAMTWRLDGTCYDAEQLNASDQPVPFLIALWHATHDARYRDAALAAGRFAADYYADRVYTGGACDHDNVPDKESAVLAMQAFLSLYCLTNDRSWLQPARRAATYSETYTYAWDVPLYATEGEVYPRSRTTLGVSLIAVGASGADNYMAIATRAFALLGELLADTHFTRFGAFLQDATAQVLDWDGKLGYRFPGLMNEAITLAPPRGHGVAKWLPWLTAAVLEPRPRVWGSEQR